jgi:hypothetical protein
MTGYESKKKAAQDKLDSMERETLKLAIEALSSIIHGTRLDAAGNRDDDGLLDTIRDHHRFKKRINAALVAITAIEEALAQPAQAEQCNYPDCKCPTENPCLKGLAQPAQEPVAWLEPEWGEKICPEVGYEVTMTDDHPRDLGWIPLYTTPSQRTWVDLTDTEIDVEANSILTSDPVQWWRRLARAVLAKSKEKNSE